MKAEPDGATGDDDDGVSVCSSGAGGKYVTVEPRKVGAALRDDADQLPMRRSVLKVHLELQPSVPGAVPAVKRALALDTTLK